MRKLLAIFTLTLISLSGISQADNMLPEFRMGATVGTHYAYLKYPIDFIINRVNGFGSFHAGGWMKVKLMDPVYARVEGIYSVRRLKGDYIYQFQEDDGEFYYGIDSKITDTFFEIPFIGEYYASRDISAYGGLHLAFLLNSKVEVNQALLEEYAENSDVPLENITVPDRKNFELGYLLGIQYQANDNLAFGGRYTRMLTTAYSGHSDLNIRYGMYQFYLVFELR